MWDKSFLARLYKLSLPIMLQQLFAVAGNSITTLMTGQLGDQAIATSGLAYQLFLLLSLAQFGVSSGCGIFTAQYWGSRDSDSIHKTLGVALLVGVGAGVFFALVAALAPRIFLSAFTADEAVVTMGVGFLRIVAVSYLFTPVINVYGFVLRSIGIARLPMLVSTSGVLINAVFGYALIFGRLGMPQMGLNGAAYANLIGRVSECLLLVWMVYYLKTPLAVPISQLFSFDRNFFGKITRRVFPVVANEVLWAMGFLAYNAIYAHISTESIAAFSINTTVDNMLLVPIIGLVNACAILVGNAIGAGKGEKASSYVRQTVIIAMLMAGLIGAGLIVGRAAVAGLFHISSETRFFTINLFVILGATLWLRSANMIFLIGMMRSGGDTRFAYIMDVGATWLLGVPLALVGAFRLHLPVHWVYLLAMVEEAIKFFLSIWRLRSKRWIHNLVGA